MYESPIKVFQTIEQHSGLFDAEKDKLIYNTVQGVCVDVDKDELLKALAYDRQQYQKGYADGVRDVIKRFKNRNTYDFYAYGISYSDEFLDSLIREMRCKNG